MILDFCTKPIHEVTIQTDRDSDFPVRSWHNGTTSSSAKIIIHFHTVAHPTALLCVRFFIVDSRYFIAPGQLPAIVIRAILMVGEATELRHSRSLPIISIPHSISFRFPAIVISSTGWVSSPFSIQIPTAPRE